MTKLLQHSVSAAVLMVLFATQASAVIVVRDTWRDSTRTDPASTTYSENGTDSDTDGDIESAWFRGSGAGSTGSVAPGHMIHAAATGTTNSLSLTTYFTPDASPVSLINDGDSIVVTWTFTPIGVSTTGSGNQDMRVALLNAPNAARISTDISPGSAIYSGYGSFWNMRATTVGNAVPLRTMEWAVLGGSNNVLSTAGAYVQVAATAGTVGTTPGFNNDSTTQYTFTMSVTKTVAGADIVQSITGGSLGAAYSLAYSDPSPQSLVFDTFALRPTTPATTATSWDTNLFQVEFIAGTAIPEPALLPILAAGLLGLTAVVRRRLR